VERGKNAEQQLRELAEQQQRVLAELHAAKLTHQEAENSLQLVYQQSTARCDVAAATYASAVATLNKAEEAMKAVKVLSEAAAAQTV
jgi:hypothetical protein